jgi:hypothetical protein
MINRRRAIAKRNGRFDLEDLISAAQRLGSYGEQLGGLAAALQRVREGEKKSD